MATTLAQDGVIYAATLHHELVAITTKDGAVRWRHPLSFNVFEAPVLAGGVLLVVEEERSDRAAILSTHLDAFDAATGALHAQDGSVAWRSDAVSQDSAYESLGLAEGLIYGTEYGRVFVLDAATGRALWHYPEQPSAPFAGVRGAVLAGGTVYLSMYEGTYLALDAHTGAVRWQTLLLFDVDLGTPVGKLLSLVDLPLVAGAWFSPSLPITTAYGGRWWLSTHAPVRCAGIRRLRARSIPPFALLLKEMVTDALRIGHEHLAGQVKLTGLPLGNRHAPPGCDTRRARG